jgi:hypothetical protein
MNYNFQLKKAIKEEWQEARNNYLASIYVKEEEIKKYQYEEYFYFDGVRVWMPDHLVNATRYRKYLLGV